jgi:tetratricopeptide (TPR) repeat protein
MGIPPFFRNPKNPTILTEAIYLYCSAQYIEAQEFLNELLPQTSGNVSLSVSNWLAKVSRALKQNEQAISVHLLSVSYVPQAPDYLKGGFHIGFGLSRFRQGRESCAARHFETAIQHFMVCGEYSDYAMAENNLCCLMVKQNRAEEAIPNLLKARNMLASADMFEQVAIVDDTLAMAHRRIAANYSLSASSARKETMRKILG